MQWRHLATAVVLGGVTMGGMTLGGMALGGMQAEAAPLSPGLSRGAVTAATTDPHVQQAYWVWRGGVRVWVGGPPRPVYAPGPYWWHHRRWQHRRWYNGGWRYW